MKQGGDGSGEQKGRYLTREEFVELVRPKHGAFRVELSPGLKSGDIVDTRDRHGVRGGKRRAEWVELEWEIAGAGEVAGRLRRASGHLRQESEDDPFATVHEWQFQGQRFRLLDGDEELQDSRYCLPRGGRPQPGLIPEELLAGLLLGAQASAKPRRAGTPTMRAMGWIAVTTAAAFVVWLGWATLSGAIEDPRGVESATPAAPLTPDAEACQQAVDALAANLAAPNPEELQIQLISAYGKAEDGGEVQGAIGNYSAALAAEDLEMLGRTGEELVRFCDDLIEVPEDFAR